MWLVAVRFNYSKNLNRGEKKVRYFGGSGTCARWASLSGEKRDWDGKELSGTSSVSRCVYKPIDWVYTTFTITYILRATYNYLGRVFAKGRKRKEFKCLRLLDTSVYWCTVIIMQQLTVYESAKYILVRATFGELITN